ncbi:CidA/LrgA family protein [Clostridiisalibacter paucivorans]|uniref:CidA/LrgA family protein n=1 Tax=Clostridiisalibacter paucivorans TaxID=408753 RepID=UPI00047C678E|nr:CidA/LrgA family protein [Clostridiisalibacter paucivorans]
MNILLQFGIIVGIWQIGELISYWTNLPIPGTVLGMIILFILLNTKIIKIEDLKISSDFLLNNLAFFFIPAGVALIGSIGVLKDAWLSLLIITLLTTFIVMGITGLIVENMIKWRKNK